MKQVKAKNFKYKLIKHTTSIISTVIGSIMLWFLAEQFKIFNINSPTILQFIAFFLVWILVTFEIVSIITMVNKRIRK